MSGNEVGHNLARSARQLRAVGNRRNLAGARVQERRLALDMRQEELAARLSALTSGGWEPDYQEISRLESGHRLLSDLELVVLAVALDTDLTWLLTGADERVTESSLRTLVMPQHEQTSKPNAEATETGGTRRRGPRRPR